MKKYFFILLIIFTTNIYSQGEANFWYFGQNAGIDFNSGGPISITGSLNTLEGCSSFSDKNGNLLFYSDGTTVWDTNGAIMPNGTNLKGNSSSSQSAIIVPHPGNPNLFYIFTVGANYRDDNGNNISTEGLHCYTVDMTANSGFGDVVGVPFDLSNGFNSQWTEKVTSVKGADCNTFWVVSLVNNTYYSYKIDDIIGLNPIPIISTVSYYSSDSRGYLKVSPDGKKLASATYTAGTSNGNFIIGNGKLHLYSFNDLTGEVSNDGVELISSAATDGAPYGVEFSPQSNILYTSTHDNVNNKLYQFDLLNSNIISSKYLVKSQVGYRGALQLAPDGKIYATVPINYNNGTRYLDAINSPDKLGANCNYQLDALNLGSGIAMQGLPPFIASLLLPIEITDGITNENINKTVAKRCLGDSFQISAENITGMPTYKWIFNGSTIEFTNTLSIPTLSHTDTGTYYLEVETTDACGFRISYKGEVSLEVYNPPTVTPLTNILQCDNDNDGYFNFDFNALKDTEVLSGQSTVEFEVLYFTNLTDATSNTNENAIILPYTNATSYGTETIFARIQNKQNASCFEIESFTIQVFESPNPPTSISNLSKCDTNTVGTDIDGFETFDLTQKATEILNGQIASKFTISYFSDAGFTNQITNTTSFPNTTFRTQPIYVQIVNNNNSNCTTTTSFNIEVLSLPAINASFVFKQCDSDGLSDGITDFNLNEANDYISNGDTSLNITYYLTHNNALNGANPIVAAPFSNATQPTVYARLENVNGCFRVAQIDLLVSSTSFPNNYLKTVTHCDDDNTFDGKNLFDLSLNNAEIISLFPTGQNLKVAYYRNLTDAQLEQNNIDDTTPYLNETAFNQTLYVRVESEDNGECFGLGPYLNLVVNPRPEFELDATGIFCTNLPPITVSIYNPNGTYTYEWTDENGLIISKLPSAIISKKGTYTVIAKTIEGCESFPKIIEIKESSIASITIDDITIVDDSDNNTITISTTNLGIGDYEYSLDDMYYNYQTEPFFENVAPGIHTIFIKDNNNCGIFPIEVSIIGYPKFFTPNNDGYNDTWKILGVTDTYYVNSNIYIYDRYGKLITKIDPKGNGWDGTFNGKYLPSTDYWFSVELIDNNGNIKIRKGHFSLIRH